MMRGQEQGRQMEAAKGWAANFTEEGIEQGMAESEPRRQGSQKKRQRPGRGG